MYAPFLRLQAPVRHEKQVALKDHLDDADLPRRTSTSSPRSRGSRPQRSTTRASTPRAEETHYKENESIHPIKEILLNKSDDTAILLADEQRVQLLRDLRRPPHHAVRQPDCKYPCGEDSLYQIPNNYASDATRPTWSRSSPTRSASTLCYTIRESASATRYGAYTKYVCRNLAF